MHIQHSSRDAIERLAHQLTGDFALGHGFELSMAV